MRKIIKPEDIRRDKKVVKIPDVEFEVEVFDENPEASDENLAEASKETVVTQELREQITGEIRDELAGELGRRKIKAQKECDMLIRDAKNEAGVIVAQANSEKERILNEARIQAQQITAEAYEEGAKNGFKEKTALLDNLALYISHSIEEIKKEKNQFFKEYAKELKHLSVEICEKVISQKVEEDDMIMYGVIKNAIRYARDTKWIKADVSSQLSGYIDSLEKELHDSGQNVEFILSESVPKDTCILNTSDGLVVATLSEQIKNLREFINTIDKGDTDEN